MTEQISLNLLKTLKVLEMTSNLRHFRTPIILMVSILTDWQRLSIFLEVYQGSEKVDKEQCILAGAGRALLVRLERKLG